MGSHGMKKWLGLSVTALMSVIICTALFFSDRGFHSPKLRWLNKNLISHPDLPAVVEHESMKDETILAKGDRVNMGKISLVFKGIHDKHLLLDLYLDEFDPDIPFLQKFPDTGGRCIQLGEIRYRVLTATGSALVLAPCLSR